MFSEQEKHDLQQLKKTIAEIDDSGDIPFYRRILMLTQSSVFSFYPGKYQKTVNLLKKYEKQQFLMPTIIRLIQFFIRSL